MLNAQTGQKVADIKLPGHPESFQLESTGSRIFVNVPSVKQVAVVDRQKAAVVATWALEGAHSNFPMALDEAGHRLFIGCRSPAKLIVLDTESGKQVASLDCVGDADNVFFDAASKRAYVSGGAGQIDVFEQSGAGQYKLVSQTPTAVGARTSFLLAGRKVLCLAVPSVIVRGAALRVYALD